MSCKYALFAQAPSTLLPLCPTGALELYSMLQMYTKFALMKCLLLRCTQPSQSDLLLPSLSPYIWSMLPSLEGWLHVKTSKLQKIQSISSCASTGQSQVEDAGKNSLPCGFPSSFRCVENEPWPVHSYRPFPISTAVWSLCFMCGVNHSFQRQDGVLF